MNKDKTYTNLTWSQVKNLKKQGCTASDWSKVKVAQPFDSTRVRNAHFTGNIQIGTLDKTISLFGGIKAITGIYNAKIHNCTLGNNIYINNIENYIANYDIRDNVIIKHVSILATEGPSSFGNGTQVSVINEVTGREIPIYDHLSAHIAYIIAIYRHRPSVIEKLKEMIQKYTDSVTSTQGTIDSNSKIINCGTLKNVKIGPNATLDGPSHLENGTINSCPEDPSFVGTNVIAKDFILSSGAKVTDNSIICHCFVGQGTELSKQYSAENSVFFANCGGFHGEACSIFAGPYTVTFHKSTLLIAGLYSFLNAGSGSNQSNHMYKLGPVHQGVIERGSKTTSDSYILWPAKVGAFSLVMGRHYANSDTSDLPFSYLIEHKDESVLVPGVNLRSIGTVRDSRKWPKRDKRKAKVKHDKIIFNLLTPYTVQKMYEGLKLLRHLKESSGLTSQNFYYNGVKIKRSSLEHGISFYQMGIDRFLGNILVRRLRENDLDNMELLRSILTPTTSVGKGKWLDIAGLITPQKPVNELLDEIESGSIDSLDSVNDKIEQMYESFEDYQWTWVVEALEHKMNKPIDEFESEDIQTIIKDWIESVEKLDRMRLDDAQKEFGPASKISFGNDGDNQVRDDDFKAVRGDSADNAFTIELAQRLEQKKQTAKTLIDTFKLMS